MPPDAFVATLATSRASDAVRSVSDAVSVSSVALGSSDR